jgi:outer membrane protein OmpA-like peptidoglycan-associated protein
MAQINNWKAKIKAILIISFLLIASSLAAQERGVEIALSGKGLIETEPRKMVNTTFIVTNTSSEKREFISNVKLPKGWSMAIEDLSFELDAYKSDVRITSFVVPREAAAGEYQIIYQVRAKDKPSISDSCSLEVVIMSITSIQAKLLNSPEYVIAGNPYQATFVFINESNTKKNLIIETYSGDNLPYTISAEKLELAPSESKTIAVTINTDDKLRTLIKHQIELNVKVVENKDMKIQAFSSVDIIPRITGDGDRFFKIPAQIAVYGNMSQREDETLYGVQGEFSGSGFLDETRKKSVEFLFRGPNTRKKGDFGEFDEYRFNLSAENYRLGIGDNFYSLTPLTDHYNYGRGAIGELGIGKVRVGTYYQESRWITPKEKSMAGYIRYKASEKYKISLNYLRKTGVSSYELRKAGISDFGIASLYGQLKPIKNSNIDLEFASGEKGYAYLMNAYGYHRKISYSAQILHADPDYPGYHRDRDSILANVAIPIIDKFGINAGFHKEKYNLDMNQDLYSAYFEIDYRAGLDVHLLKSNTISLNYIKRSLKDRFSESKLNYDETTYRLEVEQQFKKMSLNAATEMGQSMDNLTGRSSRVEIYELYAHWMPTIRQSYSGYVNYRKNVNYAEEKYDNVIAGIDGSLRLGNKNYIKLSARTREYIYKDHDYRVSNLDLGLAQSLWNDHKIIARGRWTSSKNQNTISAMVEYIVPLKLPVGRKKDIGVVKGHIYNEESKEPVANVILILDKKTAVTDKNGNFVFPSPKVGNHQLYVNQSSLAAGLTVIQPTPIDAVVKSDKECIFEIGISRSSTVSGRVVTYDFEDAIKNGYLNGSQKNVKIVESSGSPNIFLEIINDKVSMNQVTDRDGIFCFDGLHPGRWTLKINDKDLPDNHYLEKNSFEFNLKPGEKSEILVKILPKIRQIRILEEGGKVGVGPSKDITISKKVDESKVLDTNNEVNIDAAIIKTTENTVKDIENKGIGKYMGDQAKEMQKEVSGAKVDVSGQGDKSKINLVFDSGFLFDTNKSNLNIYTLINLKKFAEIIKKYPNTNILIEGNTDSIGKDDHNMELSMKRANAVGDYLVQQKVDSNRITTKWYGKTKPIADNETEEGRQQNRRVEITITPN